MPSKPEIPEGWRRVRLGDICDAPRYGANAPALNYDPAQPRYVRITDITDNGRLRTDEVRSADPEIVRGHELREGDLLFARSGSVGRTYLYRPSDGRCVYAGYLIRFRPDAAVALPRFLDIYTHSPTYLRWLQSVLHVGAQPNINAAEYSALPVLLPPIAEQQAIAAVLDSIDEAIERTEEVIAATERLRDALLHDLLTRGLPGRHTEWKEVRGLGTIPASWDVVRLGDVPTLNQPGAWGDEPTDDDPGVRVLRAADLTRDGRVHTEKAAWRRLGDKDRERRLMQDGDLILERSGGGPAAPVGRIALIEESAPIYCSNFCQHLRLDATRCSARFAARALWHRYMRGVTERLEQRTTGIRNLDYEGYLMYPIPLPSMREQEAIADALDSAESAIESERDRLSALELMKSSTADALLSGQLNATQQKE